MIKIEKLSKSFKENKVLSNISMQMKEGSTIAIIGPSGSGKSTLLRCLNRLETPESGSLSIDGETFSLTTLDKTKIAEIRKKSAMVFQHYNLFANKSVLDNITLALKVVKKANKAEANQMALELLDKVGLSDKKDAYPATLSGGQQQRVAIARALALRPKLMLYDEPTSSLDPELVNEVLSLIKSIANEDITSIIVTHEIQFAKDVADYVIFIEDGEIVEEGTPNILFSQPKKDRTKQFLNKFISTNTNESKK